MNRVTGEITWTPTGVGVFTIAVILQDGNVSATTTNIQVFDLTVADRPALDIDDISLDEGALLSFDLNTLVVDLDVDDTHAFVITDDGGSDDLLVSHRLS